MSEVTILATGRGFPEGSVVCRDGSVVLTEIRHGRCTQVTPDGSTSVFSNTGGSVLDVEMAPTLAAANALSARRLAEAVQGDANNQLRVIEAIQDYHPEPDLNKITAKVLLINDAENHVNSPERGTVERAMQRVKHGRSGLSPAGPDTHGHVRHDYATRWKPYLIEFLATRGPEPTGVAAAASSRRGGRAKRGMETPRAPARSCQATGRPRPYSRLVLPRAQGMHAMDLPLWA